MKQENNKFFIVSRSFWPVYRVFGEAMLRLAEKRSQAGFDVGVILQDHVGIYNKLAECERGEDIDFYPCRALSVASSSIIRRVVDSLFFMIWVAWCLLRKRPSQVYVSTDPPVLIPFVVMLYCKLFGARYYYHLQDIHPESANTILKINPLVFSILRWLDTITMRNASVLLTITAEMAQEVRARTNVPLQVHVISNPSVSFDSVIYRDCKIKGFSFCGNLGRLQRIPVLIEAITLYCEGGGSLPFVFAGAGLYAPAIAELADTYDSVTYRGLVSESEAAQISMDFEWGLLPIEDEVTRYAFPSKSSSYVFADSFIAAICGDRTSVAEWVVSNKLGIVITPKAQSLCEFFFSVEKNKVDVSQFGSGRTELKGQLDFDVFVERLDSVLH